MRLAVVNDRCLTVMRHMDDWKGSISWSYICTRCWRRIVSGLTDIDAVLLRWHECSESPSSAQSLNLASASERHSSMTLTMMIVLWRTRPMVFICQRFKMPPVVNNTLNLLCRCNFCDMCLASRMWSVDDLCLSKLHDKFGSVLAHLSASDLVCYWHLQKSHSWIIQGQASTCLVI